MQWMISLFIDGVQHIIDEYGDIENADNWASGSTMPVTFDSFGRAAEYLSEVSREVEESTKGKRLTIHISTVEA